MRYLLDADSIIDYFAHQPGALAQFPQVLAAGAGVSGTTTIELFTGAYGARDPQTSERQLRQFLRTVRILPLNRAVIVQTARLRRQLLDIKAPIAHRAYDLITAATALVYDLTLVTSNTKDFADIPGLTLLNPRTGAALTT
ncbi:MAG: type II toxin-antitoxin system VapC family toxin [Chloroflexota bacterium]|nr:type II toxin-antitoxin system VapC family toxin [Chloroflexota bacterium]